MPWNGTNAEPWSCLGGVLGARWQMLNSGAAIKRYTLLG